MILKVDLQCSSCYKKIKKLLCKFPQIRDQVYDEKQNVVKITLICCSPEKIRDKLCCKGRKTIKSIEIKEPEKKDKKPDKPPKVDPPPVNVVDKPPKEDPKPNPPPPPPPGPVVVVYPPAGYPIGVCCGPCSEGISGGPCFHGFGMPPPPPPAPHCYPPCHCYGRPCYITVCDCYPEGNPSACRVM